ncbi:NAD-dependent succinate-semialdehyde dehydrogenase [Sulfobacillus sp. hq2]|uniref:NAD-dependent succinate-semialdehyde dehydrogenase n=2 Tax=Sulfobacillus TaxID=28033 RepID=UPI000CD1138D|nr:NAD-dependent succinate-semialdehyde dehydrogenase [Sulfobacillus sp. hq2]POB11296.1 succinate-semialdehyde dehydrogenase (NADP(+)) [Sulfobacillus sp. hq2]
MEIDKARLYIGGEWTEAAAGTYFDVVNPATEQVIARVPDAGPQDMRRAIDAALAVQASWADAPAAERAQILLRAAQSMRAQLEDLARLMTEEEGKPLSESRGEIAYAASFFEWFAEEAKRVYGEIIPANSANKRILVIKRPVGLSLAITPWNFPAAMITRKVGPALAAGCPVIVKPSELTPLSAFAIAKILEDAGLPLGVLSVLTGTQPGPLVQVAMDEFSVRKISFTGSTAVGKRLMVQAAETMKRVSLELGGQAPFIVFADADLDAAVENAVIAKMRSVGESCVAANRMYVQRPVLEAFSRKLTDALATMRMGDGLQNDVTVGPLIDGRAVAKVERHVADAQKQGARLLLGGTRPQGPGYFYPPTVLAGVTDSMLIAQEETFGPVAAILAFDTEDEVIARANNTRAGLAAYYFTRDVGRVMRLAEHLEYGILGANDGLPSTAQAPFGGMKESGLGREGSHYGIDEYLDIKYVSLGGINC